MRGLIWFKDDLRTHDNTALYHAAKYCKQGIAAVYALDAALWQKHDVAACRVDLILRGLQDLKTQLDKLNIPFILLEVKSTDTIPTKLHKLADTENFSALFFNRQYEINEMRRDNAVETLFKKNNLEVFSYHDQVIIPPGIIKTGQGKDYSVFTPYKRAWIKTFLEREIKILPAPKRQQKLTLKITSQPIPTQLSAFTSKIDNTLWLAGETAAKKLLQKFLNKNLAQYKKERDFPALDSTSKLSPYLASGMISPRHCFLSAMARNHNEIDTGNSGATTWLGELIWREFYKHLLISAPRVSMNKAYQIETDNLKWDYNERLFLAWQQGKTGYPIIDAAMRQLNAIGWMHNRLRMIVAMFLTKNLFFDWRLGEKYFMSNLIDGDLAANNGGWQWSASTGTDSAPYFRIFNPILQSEKFDPEGQFIKMYCPELSAHKNNEIHNPHKKAPEKTARSGYPTPIIDLNQNRERVLAGYKNLMKKK
jgi:deoxyribodipyrimidine photo-lyase